MKTVYFNGNLLSKEEVKVSPDDRGFIFGDGIYEVVRWYQGYFYDMEGHVARLKRSLKETRINWPDADSFPSIANDLILKNNLRESNAMIYLQVTRGAAKRTHSFPMPEVAPTVYSYVWGFTPDIAQRNTGLKVMLKDDIRWSRCDIKSIALLANTMSFQEAYEKGFKECLFVRDGIITEGSRSNAFFIFDDILYTHPESNYILSGVTRKNIIRIAKKAGIKVIEEAVPADRLPFAQEAFISNTSSEVTPVTCIGDIIIGEGSRGPITKLIGDNFDSEVNALKG